MVLVRKGRECREGREAKTEEKRKRKRNCGDCHVDSQGQKIDIFRKSGMSGGSEGKK